MRKYLRISLAILFLAILATQFTNCGDSADSSLFNTVESLGCLSGADDNVDCFEPAPENLSLSTSVTNLAIKQNQSTFNIGGNCNEGNFPANHIDWEVQDSSSLQPVMSSTGGPDPVCSNASQIGNLAGVCIGGRYSLTITLPGPNVGLNSSSGGRKNFILRVCIRGVDRQGLIYPSGTSMLIDLKPM